MSASQTSSSPSKQPLPDLPIHPKRIKHTIVAGLVITNEEAQRWYKEYIGHELCKGHRDDFNIPFRLEEAMRQGELADLFYECVAVPRPRGPNQTGVNIHEFLIITRYAEGEWEHNGPDDEEPSVDLEELRPGAREERVKELLKHDRYHGIETSGFRKYFEDEDDGNDDFEEEVFFEG